MISEERQTAHVTSPLTGVDVEEKYGQSMDELFSMAPYNPEEAERVAYSEYSYWKSVFKNFLHRKSVIIMGSLFIFLLVFSFIAPKIGKYSIDDLHTNMQTRFITPNSEYWFGTDDMGRDYWVQVWSATLISVKLSGGVAIGTMVLGVIVGLFWGYVRKVDRLLLEINNIISNIPNVIYMTLVGLFVGTTLMTLMVAMILVSFLGQAKQIRNLVLMYRDREYNLASRCLGTGLWTVLFRNILPYLVSIIVMSFALSIPGTIGAETTLSYLGLGLSGSYTSLGVLLRNARSVVLQYPHLLFFPAVIVSVITIAFYIAGNAFSDACDPKNHV